MRPLTNRLKGLHKFRLDLPVRLRAHIQQKIASPADDLDQAANQRVDVLKIPILGTIGPSFVNRHTGFPWLEVFWALHGYRLFVRRTMIRAGRPNPFYLNRLRNELLEPVAVSL